MPHAARDWKIGARDRIRRSPELHLETVQEVRDLLASGNVSDARTARRIARDLLELDFANDAELLALLREPAVV